MISTHPIFATAFTVECTVNAHAARVEKRPPNCILHVAIRSIDILMPRKQISLSADGHLNLSDKYAKTDKRPIFSLPPHSNAAYAKIELK